MDFLNRIKKELTEGIVRAILTDAGYRVVGLGVENVVREVECLTAMEYAGLDLPKTMRSLPDLMVMDRNQTSRRLVEIKYRAKWSASIFDEMAEQVGLFGEVVLVHVNANPPVGNRFKGPSTNMRCCVVRNTDGQPEAQLVRRDEMTWVRRADVGDHESQWWGLVPIQRIFDQIRNAKGDQTLVKAIQSLQGILDS